MGDGMTDREQIVADTVSELGRVARDMIEKALSVDTATTRYDLPVLVAEAEKLAELGEEFRGLYERLKFWWLPAPRTVHVGHEMSST
jgi:hypothetical protein